MNTMRQFPALFLFLFVGFAALALPGCQFGKSPALAGAGMDMFTPVKMRLHPLTRVVPAAATAEARLEFTDQFNDICKGAGTVYFELFLYESLVPNHHGERIGLWNFDLNTPASNQQHWDGITRTYLCKLPAPAIDKKFTRLLLHATFTLPNGTRLTDDIPINLK